jgi:hypothetical protein
VADDGPALTKALVAGKIVHLAENVTYLLTTPESDDEMATVYPNTTIIGHGVTSKIKIADGVLGVRNVFSVDTTITATDDQGTITLKDFYVDLNGENNVRADSGEPARNNALLRAYYFRHVIVDGVIAENAPGNQIIWAYTPLSTETNSSATVKNCRFYKVGNDLTGNYNADHSTSYLQAHHVKQYNNLFIKSSATTSETAMELHGKTAYCENNVVINYNRGAHVVADMDTPMIINKVSGNYMSTRLASITYWSEDAIHDVNITDNTFTGYGGESYSGIDMETHVDAGYIYNVNIHNNVFKNNTFTTEASEIYLSNYVKNASIIDNIFDTINWQAVDSDATDSLIVRGNTFNNCAKAGAGDAIIKVMAACDRVAVQNNNFIQALYYSEDTVWIAGNVDHGVMSGNLFHTWYNDWPIYFTGDGTSSTSFFVDIELYMDSSAVPDADVYGTKGSVLKNLNSGNSFIRSSAGFGNGWIYTQPNIFLGTGSPENVVTAPIGSLYLDAAGSTSTTLYVKTSGTGNTGWTAK